MWRIFRWLDTHPPGFHKFTVMLAGLAGIGLLGCLIALAWHPAAGFLSGAAALFALMRASMTYRFEKKPKPASGRDLPIAQASDQEVLRRVRRHEGTEKLRRHILWLAEHDRGKRGDRARGIVASWKEAEARKNKNSAD